jgi:hypothetical protein
MSLAAYASTTVEHTNDLLSVKSLSAKYKMRKNRSDAWKSRREVLIKEFEEKVKNDLNSKDKILSKRAQKRKKEFYASINKRDKELSIAKKTTKKKIYKLKKKLSLEYEIPPIKKEFSKKQAKLTKTNPL